MNKYELFIALVVLFNCVVRIKQVGAAGGHFDLLDFWVRDEKYKTTTAKDDDLRRNGANQKTMAPQVIRALEKAKLDMQQFFKDLYTHNSNDKIKEAIRELQKVNAKLGLDSVESEQIKTYRRAGHSHGPHHRWKNGNSISHNQPRQYEESAENSDEARKHLKPNRIHDKETLRAFRMFDEESTLQSASSFVTKQTDPENTAPTDKVLTTKARKTESTTGYVPITGNLKHALSPYSLYQELNSYIIPRFPELNISMEILGRTVEYNNIILMKITQSLSKIFRSRSEKYDDVMQEKKALFIVHGLSVMGFNDLPCMRTLHAVERLYSFYFKHLDQFDIFLMPMANPDGVSAAYAKSFWNKNMSPQEACPGVALDRNFDIAWNPGTVSSCSQHFPGTTPFSEPESQAVRDVLHKYSHNIVGYFHVHASSYSTNVFKGDAVLYPKGYSDSQTDDDKYIDLKGEIEEMMRNASFKVLSVSVETLYNWYGKVTGSSVDYACSVYGVPFCMELAMQLYEDDRMVDLTEERETGSALNEIWQRLIDVIFDFIHKSLTKIDKKR